MASEPMWTIAELAAHKKVSFETLRGRCKAERARACNPLPNPIMFADSVAANGDKRTMYIRRRTHRIKRYLRSELLAWFDAEDAHKPFKRQT